MNPRLEGRDQQAGLATIAVGLSNLCHSAHSSGNLFAIMGRHLASYVGQPEGND